jgi:GTPase
VAGDAVAAGPPVPPAPATSAPPPRVVLVGRPNAGKSTLFNRLLRRRKAVVDPTPGVTRDPNEAQAVWDGRTVVLVDTGGFEAGGAAGIDREVRDLGFSAVAAADLVLYVLDGKSGLSPADEAAVRELRRRRANVLFVVNKLDVPAREIQALEFHRLGVGELLGVSAEHGHGISDLVEAIVARVEAPSVEAPARGIRVGVIGRPNVGKSSLVNRLLGYPRALVAPTAGTTRDAVDSVLEVAGTRYVLVDTAGIRRRSRIQERLERAATGKALETLTRSDVVVVVIDASEGVTTQDQRLAGLAWQEGRGVVVVANKIDLVSAAAVVVAVRRAMPALARAPILGTSAVTGAGIDAIWPAVRGVAAAHDAALKTSRLNDVVAAAVRAKEPPLARGRRPRLYYAVQVSRRPPTVAVFTSAPTAIPPGYQRYLENQIATAFQLEGTPVRVQLRTRR